MELKIVKLVKDAQVPEYQTQGSSGMDLHIVTEDGGILRINPGEVKLVSTGLAMDIPYGYEGQIRSRSSIAKRGVFVANQPGTVDSDYRGEVKILLYNSSDKPQHFNMGHRVAQLVIQKVSLVTVVEVAELCNTGRGEGGFGHTGV